jgi:cytochrome c556
VLTIPVNDRRKGDAMAMTVLTLGMFGLGALCLSACTSPPPQQAAPVPAPAPVEQPAPTTAKMNVSINEVMVALIDHAGHNLWDVEKEGKAPKTDAAWQVVQEHAVQLAAAGSAITVGGAGPRDAEWVRTPSWRTHAQRMSDAGVAALNAAKSKDLKALVTANGQLVESCEQCHKEFKPDLPTEGIVHSHAH